MFCIEAENVRLELKVVPVGSLSLHERTLPHVADGLILEFKNWANLENPIIVDENNIVLDGNHRAYVFKKLNFRYIPVCKIDYFHKSARLRYWFRVIGGADGMALLRRVIEEFHGDIQEVADRETLKRTLEERCFCCGLEQGNLYACVQFKEDLVYDAVSAYDMVERIQEELGRRGMSLDYVPCQHVLESDFCGGLHEQEVVIWTPQITKKMVVEAARRDKVFAPKTTRHLIPARPLNVNVPILWFKEDVSLEEINSRFDEFLQGKEVRRLGPGQVVNGRYYEEELFVFLDRQKV